MTTEGGSGVHARGAPIPGGRTSGCALITGASRGIGAETAKLLGAEGWPVVVNYRADAEGARQVVDTIERRGGQAVAIEADVAQGGDIARMFDCFEERLGPALVLVNNAGIRADMLAVRLHDHAWDQVIATNLSAVFRTTRRALMPMIRARWGRVINIASVAGVRGSPGQANYAAAKAGVIGFTKSVAIEVARRGITVNAVAPGFARTALAADVPERVIERIPTRRFGDPAEVAACVRFLASADASYVTGTTVVVDGGLSA